MNLKLFLYVTIATLMLMVKVEPIFSQELQLKAIQQTKQETLQNLQMPTTPSKEVYSFEEALYAYNNRVKEKIIGGSAAPSKRFPWHVSLSYREIPMPIYAHRCGGSIISKRWVITAAHCVNDYRDEPSMFVLLAGGTNLENMEKTLAIKQFYVTAAYKTYKEGNDIALIELEEDIAFTDTIQAVSLTDGEHTLNAGAQLSVAGFGVTKLASSTPVQILQFLEGVPYVPRDSCNAFASYNGRIVKDMICAGFSIGEKDACQYDSGGGLLETIDGKTTIVGIVSWGEGCGKPLKYGIYAGVIPFLPWIQSLTNPF